MSYNPWTGDQKKKKTHISVVLETDGVLYEISPLLVAADSLLLGRIIWVLSVIKKNVHDPLGVLLELGADAVLRVAALDAHQDVSNKIIVQGDVLFWLGWRLDGRVNSHNTSLDVEQNVPPLVHILKPWIGHTRNKSRAMMSREKIKFKVGKEIGAAERTEEKKKKLPGEHVVHVDQVSVGEGPLNKASKGR